MDADAHAHAGAARPIACPLTRRVLVVGAGAAGLTTVLGACGGSDCEPAAGRPAPEPSRSGGEPSTSGPALPLGALAPTADVPVGGGVIVEAGGPVLVVQPAEGVFKAYDAHCTHQNFVVGVPIDGVITCPGHLAHYRAGDGSLIDGPAPRGLEAVPVRVADGHVRWA